MQEREKFSSRLGFLLTSAGCAIGLGNVWRFPYIAGQYGGAAFVVIYLFFLLVLGLPIMVMEFAVGRASRRSCASSFRVLEPKGSKWHLNGYLGIAGNYLLMMIYTTISGWMLAYFYRMLRGEFQGLNAEQVRGAFTGMTANPGYQLFWLILTVLIGFGVCSMGLQKGVEKITKVMMVSLLLLLAVLAVNSVLLPGAEEGLRFYLMPDFSKIAHQGLFTVIYAAMGQAFFTLSLGIGCMSIFGSYIGKDRSLMGESLNITLLDTFVALMAGLIIFPAASAYGISADSGPSLIFVTLPNIFNAMPGGRLWGALFFLFMSFAALSTVIAVFENIVSFGMDLWGWTRKKAVTLNIFLVTALSLPCLLGFNLWSSFQPFGVGSNFMDLEDFILSSNLLPIGSLIYLFFCVTRYGWGWKSFVAEADAGKGLRFPKWSRWYLTIALPVIVIFIFIMGYVEKFKL